MGTCCTCAPTRTSWPGWRRARLARPVTGLDLLGPPQNPWTEADMMRVYNVLNATAFGDKGIPLQNWVMIDLGLLPSAFLLITLPRTAAEAALAEARRDPRRAHSARVLAAVLAEAQ